jgi:hypothetical protein
MASTMGVIQMFKQSDPRTAFVSIGPTPDSTELFFIVIERGDHTAARAQKRAMMGVLSRCQGAGTEVELFHDNNSGLIKAVSVGIFDISPMGRPIHGDLYSVSAYQIPDDAELVFDSPIATVHIVPDVVRPHVLIISQLPTVIPVGRNRIRIESASWTSGWVPVEVFSSPPQTVRTLYSGSPKENPYTFFLAANGAIEQAAGGTFYQDPILGNRGNYNDAIVDCIQSILNVDEDIFRRGGRDVQYRIVSVFDPTLTAQAGDSLCKEIAPNLMEARRDNFNSFASRYAEKPDIGVAIHGSAVFDRATAWYTTDDTAKGGVAYTYDGNNHQHGSYPNIPGTFAIYEGFDRAGQTPIHELCHATSDFNNGRVNDLYNDGNPPAALVVNKKWRNNAADPIPANFANYNGANYLSDQNRNGIGYPAGWRSYHAEQIDNTVPNLMDNYWQAANPHDCRLDHITYDWFNDRLAVKLRR